MMTTYDPTKIRSTPSRTTPPFLVLTLMVASMFDARPSWGQAQPPTRPAAPKRQAQQQVTREMEDARRQAAGLRARRRAAQRGRAAQRRQAKAAPAASAAAGAPAGTAAHHSKKPLLAGEREFNECIRIPPGRKVKITLKPDSELADLVGWISSMTCKKFILASNLRAQKVTLISPTAVTPAVAYRAFLSSLEVMGLTVVPAGQYLKVVQGNWAIQSPIPTFTDSQRLEVPEGDTMVTQIVRAQHVDANEMLLVLNKMKSRSGDVTSYKPSNSLIITDDASNVRRMLRVIEELDLPLSGEKLWVMRLKNADAEEVLKILNQVFAQKAGQHPRPQPARGKKPAPRPGARPGGETADADVSVSKMVADPVTNSLIIVASSASFSRIASLIRKLDVEGEGVHQRIHVYYLENGDAEEVAQTLANLTAGAAAAPRGRRGGRPAHGAASAATLFEGDVKTTADKATNSLVIVASTKDFLSLRKVIRQLDIPRRQVFVEAVIMEVTLNKDRALGLSVHGGVPVGSGDKETILFGGLFPSQDFNSLLTNPAALTGLAAGARGFILDGSARLLGVDQDIPGFGVLIQALQTNGNVNVLSSPHILTTDNQEAEITVGQRIPVPAAAATSALGAAAGAQAQQFASLIPAISVNREDVALKLKITPHVNESNMVRLELDQEVSDILDRDFGGLGAATSQRIVKSTVVVRDQQTVVIGGLMSDTVRDNVTKIPLLGDIPILGYLFKHSKKSVQKTNLLIVLTPYIIRDQSDLRRIFKRKLEERREFLERYSSFRHQEIVHDIDYRHKHGLLAEINRVGMQLEQESKLLEQAQQATDEGSLEPVEMPEDLDTSSSAAGSSAPQAASGSSPDPRLKAKKPAGHDPGLNPTHSGVIRADSLKDE